ncbi:MAG: 3-isopropylmalate dehydratase large subunit [Planctomycetota bacterium]|jgi:methanogen homoaconitase large subunit
MSTLSEQILSRAAGRSVRAGDLVVVQPDRVLLHDSIGPSVIRILSEDLGVARLTDTERLAVTIDHVAPAANLATATNQKQLRQWVREQGIEHFYESGRGICHQVLIEERLALPGQIVIGTDSHSTTYGAVGAFGTGMGSTDVAVALATGEVWLRCPETVRIDCRGASSPGLGPKDLALEIIRRLGAAGATYAALEVHGLDDLSLEGRMTIASMAVEAGAKAGLIWPGGLAADVTRGGFELQLPAEDTIYAQRIEIDLAALEHRVARPGRVDDLVPVDELPDTPVDVVYVGTCTNGRSEDLERVARVLRGHGVAPGVRLMVVPASSQVLKQSIASGVVGELVDLGATLGPPGCGACIGRHLGVLAPDETCVFTGNRNFRGRMGSPDARIYLASPEVAAASAALGRLATPAQLPQLQPA